MHQAGDIIRSHRLWESYLAEHMQIPAGHLHDTAMRLEHVTSAPMQEKLAAGAGHPQLDPQGKPIPPAEK
jgi:Mn-dependent DtxR family transcriptional regulator